MYLRPVMMNEVVDEDPLQEGSDVDMRYEKRGKWSFSGWLSLVNEVDAKPWASVVYILGGWSGSATEIKN